MIINLLRFIFGYVSFTVTGDFPERLFNQLAANSVSVWGMRRNLKTISAKMSIRDYKHIREYRGKNKVRTRVKERFGLPFVLQKYKLRVGFAAGLIIYTVLLFFMSGFIWNIDVVGNTDVPTEEIIDTCKELGLYEGARKSAIDPEILRTKLALSNGEISWASVNIEGIKATVNISESIGQKGAPKKPCNLIASRDGIITELKVTEGQIAIKLGQTVTAGDILVSGVTEYKNGSVSFGASSGEVFAETERSLSTVATFMQTEKIYLGEPETRSVLTIFGLNIPLYLGSINGNYETETQISQIEHNEMYLPIRLTETTFKTTDIRAYEISEAQATILAEEMLNEIEKAELKDAEILSKNVSFETTENGVKITATYKCRENIAKQDLLLIYNQK